MHLKGICFHGHNQQKEKNPIFYMLDSFFSQKMAKTEIPDFSKKYSPPRKVKITAMISAH